VKTTTSISRKYEEALEACLKGGEESSLDPAYELGRSALESGQGILDVITTHFDVLTRIVDRSRQEGWQLEWGGQSAFLLEALAPFEMVHRGYVEANQALREANAELERRVKKRTVDLETIAGALEEALVRERANREALERSETRAARLFDSTLIGMFEADEELVFEANGAFLSMIGYGREDLGTDSLLRMNLTPEEYREGEDAAIEELKTSDETAAYEKEYIRKDGSRVPVIVGRAMLSRSPFRQVCFVLDVTEQKRAQAEVERVRNEFLGVISHELKTPLTVIKGSTAMALSSRTAPDRAQSMELFQTIDDQAEQLRELVRNLLDLTRIEAGALPVNPTENDVQTIIAEALATFEKTGEQHRVEAEVEADLPLVLVDRHRIEQVLLNLLTNAAKYSPPMTPITVTVKADGPEVIVQVKDKGMGIPPEKASLLFRKFTQLHSGGTHGVGLGLAISKGIVEAHGGRIWAESEGTGKGSIFSFALPLVEVRKRESLSAHPDKASSVGNARARILVVDDSPEVLRFVHHCLTEDGYEPLLAGDPSQVNELVKAKRPVLVLLDLRLPGVSGIDILREIRGFSQVPVVFLTADEQNAAIEEAMKEYPSVDALGKPFSPEELRGKVSRALSTRGS
jgi:PAS domain S-box-containing protein